MIEKIVLTEINNYRKLMGLTLIEENEFINEQDEVVVDTIESVTEEDIAELIEKTGKSLEEIVTSPILTETELEIIFKIAKLKNLQGYNEIITSFYKSEEYKKIITDEYLKLINEYGNKIKSDEEIPKFKYAGIIYSITEVIGKKYEEDFKDAYSIIIEYYNSNIKDQWDDFDLTGFALEYSSHISDNLDFYNFNNGDKNYSGWKIYIYAETSLDVINILQMLETTLKDNQVIFKAATLSELKNKKYKGLVIYLPYDMVKGNTFKSFFSKLNTDLSNYEKGGSIEGAKEYNKKIHYLYEFNKSFKKLPKGGVKPSEVSKYFEPNTGGDYMKEINQPDLFIGEE
jgi:hypothetical protein